MAGFRDFLRVSDAARLLGVSPGTLRNWDRAGRVVALRHPINGYRLYRRDDMLGVLRSMGGTAALDGRAPTIPATVTRGAE